MTELTKTDFRLATMLKRVAVFASAVVLIASCYDIIYEPVFVPEEDNSYFIPYDQEVIPAEGDTCWFYRELNRIVVKAFDPSEEIYPYRWKLLIDGNIVQENTREYLETYSKEVMEWWERRTELKWMDNAILFEVPANSSADERSVEVKVSVSSGLYNSEQEDDWGEWFTVFEGTQAGKVYPDEMMPSHSLEKSQANIFEPVRIDMHKCDEANSLWWYKSKGVCDSLVWSIRGFEDTKIIMEDGYESIYFGHLFTHPGELESVLSAYKDGKVIYEDVKNITITNKKDFLMFDWEEIVSGTAEGGSYHNAFDDNRWFSSGVSCEDGNPVIIFNWNNWEDNSEEENRRILREYISHIYGEPVYTEKSEVEAKWAGMFVRRDDRYRPECIWMTETSAVALFYVYNELTETGDWKIIAEPLRK